MENCSDNTRMGESVRLLKDKEPEIEVMRGRQGYLDTDRVLRSRKIVNDFFLSSSKREEDSLVYQAVNMALDIWGEGFSLVLKPDQVLYRARVVSDEYCLSKNGISVDDSGYTEGFNEDNSLEPPSDRATAGRNNREGVSYLYLSENIETVCAEIKALPESIVSLAEIAIK